MTGHKITLESGEKLARLLREMRHQPANSQATNKFRWQYPIPIETRLFKAVLVGDMDSGSSVLADIKQLSDDSTVEEDATVYNSIGLFDDLLTGSECLVYLQQDRYQIIQPIDAGAGSGDNTNLVQFTLTANLAAGIGSTAAATVTAGYGTGAPTSGSITVTNTGQSISFTGCTGLAIRVGTSGYLVLDVQQRAETISGTAAGAVTQFTGATLSNPTARSQWPYTYLPTVDNEGTPQIAVANTYDFKGATGDKIVAQWDHANTRYEVVDVLPTIAKRWFFRFAATWPNGLAQTGTATHVVPQTVAHGFKGRLPVSAEILVVDRYNLAHNAGPTVSSMTYDTGVAVWNDEQNSFEIENCTHRATRCIGTIATAFSGTPATISVAVSQTGPLDGKHPGNVTSGSANITVQNRYSWEAGDSGGEIEIFRDPHNGNWYPVQMECPS